jgi:alpha,alpha-trehalose-phosphate synthase [UDP-forming]
VIYHDQSGGGWVAALTDSSGAPDPDSALWLPFVKEEAEIPLTWWRHLHQGTRALPAMWHGQPPPAAAPPPTLASAIPASPQTAGGGEQPGRTPGDLVIVANRLPVHCADPGSGPVHWHPSPGGLASALRPVVQDPRAVWVGWPGQAGPVRSPLPVDGVTMAAVPLDSADVQDYYNGFSNGTLWPLYHDIAARPEYNDRWWSRYVAVNERFAAATTDCAAPHATVWIHDYHLQLVPALLRARRPDLTIGFFSHIPFPPRDLFAQLPWREKILRGILGADLVGFQRHSDVENFTRSCRDFSCRAISVLPTPSGQTRALRPIEADAGSGESISSEVRIGAFPISIDFALFDRRSRQRGTRTRAQRTRELLGSPTTVLLGVDRLDYTKGILHRLQAFEELLARGDLDPDRTVLVQVAVPSRDRIPDYRTHAEQVAAVVGRINGTHATAGHPVVHYTHRQHSSAELTALYLAADVLLVTSLRDGMNLVAKEYVASRHDEQGALVLSEFAGAADELTAAYLVNPHDPQGLRGTIHRAATSSVAERRRRMRILRQQVRTHTAHDWATEFLDTLRSVRGPTCSLPIAVASPL